MISQVSRSIAEVVTPRDSRRFLVFADVVVLETATGIVAQSGRGAEVNVMASTADVRIRANSVAAVTVAFSRTKAAVSRLLVHAEAAVGRADRRYNDRFLCVQHLRAPTAVEYVNVRHVPLLVRRRRAHRVAPVVIRDQGTLISVRR